MTVIPAIQIARRRFSFRVLLSIVIGVYALALLVFVILRLIFGDSLWWLAFFGNFTPFYFAALIALLPLALIVRARRTVVLLIPLALIGLFTYAPPYLPKANATAAPDSFRLITFNVWGLNPDLAGVESWLRDKSADLVLIQETPPVWAGETIASLADVYPYQANQSVDVRTWGNSIWSRYPIVSAENFDIEDDGTLSQSRVVIEANGQQIAVYNIHLYIPQGETPQITLPINNPYLNMFLKYDATSRNRQIANLIERLKSEPLPYIVAGDFNLSYQAAPYRDLAALMSDSFREVGSGLGTSWPSAQAFGMPAIIPPLVRIDYIWHSDGLRALQAEEGPFLGSDHHPMLATLALK